MPVGRLVLSRRQALTGGALLAAHVGAGGKVSVSAAGRGPVAIAPTVRHVALTGVESAVGRHLQAGALADVAAVSGPVPASGYAAVGVTWARNDSIQGLRSLVRTLSGRTWSAWQPMRSGDGHGPTIGSREAREAKRGTDAVVVGKVDAVQVMVRSPGGNRPADLTLSVIDPGEISTGTISTADLSSPAYPPGDGARTPRPGIYSRAQWGADESLRNGFAGYGDIQAAFVHHTVNANDYTTDQVPAILRGIYAYHTQSRGWSDVGYNYLVDRFGRIWEGRWGGIRRPVIGAHTSGFNEEAFAMSAIGNFEVASPPREMLRAYTKLFAWKLDRFRVDGNARTTIDGVVLNTISGHRDAGSTACPGEYLYAKIPDIRARVAAAQTA